MNIKLQPVIDFGMMPIANAFVKPGQVRDEYFYNMVVGYDPQTHAIGLCNTVPPEKMFHDEYAFFSSTSKAMQQHFFDTAVRLLPYAKEGMVVEVGSNDGIMLDAWKHLGVRAIGVEPSGNVAEESRKRGHSVLSEFMSEQTVDTILQKGKVSLVFGANVSCHIEDFISYIKCVTRLIGKEGVFVFEDPYFLDMVAKTSYDQVYDEHLWYFTVSFMNKVLAPMGYHVFDAEHIGVHGGQLRMFVGHKDSFEKTGAVDYWLSLEHDLPTKLAFFKHNIEKSKTALVDLLYGQKKAGKRMCGFGASSKGVIVANYCGIGPDLLPFITDNTPIKQGTLYPGVHIPVVPQEQFKNVDVAVLFAWNHFKEIDRSQRDFRDRGGQWITHVPTPRIL